LPETATFCENTELVARWQAYIKAHGMVSVNGGSKYAASGKLWRLWREGAWRYGGPHMDKNSTPTIRDLYPHFTEQELAEAEDNLERYLALVLRIFERMESETNAQADQLTADTGTLVCTPPRSASSE
jgi:hypothetical protein